MSKAKLLWIVEKVGEVGRTVMLYTLLLVTLVLGYPPMVFVLPIWVVWKAVEWMVCQCKRVVGR